MHICILFMCFFCLIAQSLIFVQFCLHVSLQDVMLYWMVPSMLLLFFLKYIVYLKIYCINTSLDLKCFSSTVKMWCSWILVLECVLFVSCVFLHITQLQDQWTYMLYFVAFTLHRLNTVAMQAFTSNFFSFLKCLCYGCRKQNLLAWTELQNPHSSTI